MRGARTQLCTFYPHSSSKVEADPSPGPPLDAARAYTLCTFSSFHKNPKRKSIWPTRPIPNVYYYTDDDQMTIKVRNLIIQYTYSTHTALRRLSITIVRFDLFFKTVAHRSIIPDFELLFIICASTYLTINNWKR